MCGHWFGLCSSAAHCRLCVIILCVCEMLCFVYFSVPGPNYAVQMCFATRAHERPLSYQHTHFLKRVSFFFFLNSSATLLPIYISLPLLYPPLLPSISVSSRALLITRLRHGREAVFLFRDDEVWAMTCWTLCEPTVKCCHHTASPRTQSLCRGQQQSDPTAR